MALLALGCVATGPSADDLGAFEALGKADAVEVRVPFRVEPGEERRFTLRTVGRLSVDLVQGESRERLQLVAESTTYRRRSWRGRAPFLRLEGTRTRGRMTTYALSIVHWGDAPADGELLITTIDPDPPGVTLVHNRPECDGCEDPDGDLRHAVLDAIQNATVSIDLAVYGFDDPAVRDALCAAHEAGVQVRVVTDDEESSSPEHRYYGALMGETDSLLACGIPVERIRTSGIMHNKYYVIDAGTDVPVLITGSTNQTVADFETNHNHALVLRGNGPLLDAYVAEFEQLFTHCVANGCAECTPACTDDVSSEGPFEIGDARARLFFSPSDDALRELRGAARSERRAEADPSCGPDGDCLCLPSGSGYRCHYCAVDGDWGLLGEASARVHASLYAMTDPCFSLGITHAQGRGVDTTLVLDKVNSGSPYSAHEGACESGVPTLLSEWGGGSAQSRNHHKLVVVDDVVFTGSMNISNAGVSRNHENTLVIEDADLADDASGLVLYEAGLLERMGVGGHCRLGDRR